MNRIFDFLSSYLGRMSIHLSLSSPSLDIDINQKVEKFFEFLKKLPAIYDKIFENIEDITKQSEDIVNSLTAINIFKNLLSILNWIYGTKDDKNIDITDYLIKILEETKKVSWKERLQFSQIPEDALHMAALEKNRSQNIKNVIDFVHKKLGDILDTENGMLSIYIAEAYDDFTASVFLGHLKEINKIKLPWNRKSILNYMLDLSQRIEKSKYGIFMSLPGALVKYLSDRYTKEDYNSKVGEDLSKIPYRYLIIWSEVLIEGSGRRILEISEKSKDPEKTAWTLVSILISIAKDKALSEDKRKKIFDNLYSIILEKRA